VPETCFGRVEVLNNPVTSINIGKIEPKPGKRGRWTSSRREKLRCGESAQTIPSMLIGAARRRDQRYKATAILLQRQDRGHLMAV
jgi:hypothetical protein